MNNNKTTRYSEGIITSASSKQNLKIKKAIKPLTTFLGSFSWELIFPKGARGWMHHSLIWHQPNRPRWLLLADTINWSLLCSPSIFPTLWKTAERTPFRTSPLPAFPIRPPLSNLLIISPLVTTEYAYLRATQCWTGFQWFVRKVRFVQLCLLF